jgi:AcrR family transcriptional regulator
MTVQDRKQRQRAERHRLILATARELAEKEGWDAVTTRRLADRIEYSQPVLYSHFDGKTAIVGAVALEGFAELVEVLRSRAKAAKTPAAALAAVARGYLDFAAANPAVYEAMFTLPTDLPFADPQSPQPLQEAFAAIRDALAAATGTGDEGDLATRTEVAWSALHGLVDLTRSGRLPAGQQDDRLAALLALLRS